MDLWFFLNRLIDFDRTYRKKINPSLRLGTQGFSGRTVQCRKYIVTRLSAYEDTAETNRDIMLESQAIHHWATMNPRKNMSLYFDII